MKKIILSIFIIVSFILVKLQAEPTWGQHYIMNIEDSVDVLGGNSAYQLDNTTEKLVFRFTPETSVSVGKMRIRTYNGATLKIRVESVGGSGNPTGTLVDANAHIDSYSGSAWASFAGSFNLTKGTNYAVVIQYVSGTNEQIDVSDLPMNYCYWDGTPDLSLNTLYSSDGSTYTELNLNPVFAMRQSSGGTVPNAGTPFNFGTSIWTTNSYGVGEIFTMPSTKEVSGVYFYAKRRANPQQYLKIFIESLGSLDANNISSTNLKIQMNEKISDKKWWFVRFPKNITLSNGNNYAFKMLVDSLDPNTDCIIVPAGGEWYNYGNVLYPGYAVKTTHADYSSWESVKPANDEADIAFKFRTVAADALNNITLNSPANNGIVTNKPKPIFNWNTVSGADFYEFYISTNSDMSWSQYFYAGTMGSYRISSSLTTNKMYYWRVRAVQTNTGKTSLSSIYFFHITNVLSTNTNTGTGGNGVLTENGNLGLGNIYPNIIDASQNENIQFAIKAQKDALYKVSVYNLYGKKVADIGEFDINKNAIKFIDYNIKSLKRGIYFVVMTTSFCQEKKKFIIK